MEQTFGSVATPNEDIESTAYLKYSSECGNEPQFVSFVSPESPDGNAEIINNITQLPFGELDPTGSSLFRRREITKRTIDGNERSDGNMFGGLENGVTKTDQCRK